MRELSGVARAERVLEFGDDALGRHMAFNVAIADTTGA